MNSLVPAYLLEFLLINEIVMACKTHQFMLDLTDGCRTPVMYWQWIMLSAGSDYNSYQILHYLARNVDTWSILTRHEYCQSPESEYEQNHYAPIADLLQSEDLLYSESEAGVANNSVTKDLLSLEFDDYEPLLLAILRRSESELRTCCSRLDTETLMSFLKASKYSLSLVCWPIGIRTLISNGLINSSSTLVNVLWDKAMRMQIHESLKTLLPLKVYVSPEEWILANENCRKITIQTIMHTLALRFVTPITLDSPCQNLGDGAAKTRIPTPYHCGILSIWGAEGAWKAGFRDLNSAGPTLYRRHGTPLWLAARGVGNIPDGLPHIKWLLDHGAGPFWIHPEFLTTPAHVIARGACAAASRNHTLGPLDHFQHFLTTKLCDKCTCYCSQEGCYIIGCAISMYNQSYLLVSRRDFQPCLYRLVDKDSNAVWHRRTIQPYIFSLVEEDSGAVWMSSAILRVLTFEKLSLTHTCCHHILYETEGFFARPKPEEAQDIYDLERDDINLLDTLVKEFEAQWANYNKPFVTFMNRVWRPRMRRVRQVKDEEAYAAEVRRLGVVLKSKDASADSDSDSDWPDDYVSEDEDDGWHTADEEDANEGEEN
jgi:hypothetical protein